jgi:hypothetical protein
MQSSIFMETPKIFAVLKSSYIKSAEPSLVMYMHTSIQVQKK